MLAVLAANSGLDSFSIEVTGVLELAEDRQVETSVSLRATHFDGDHEHSISSQIEGVWLRGDSVAALCEAIRSWCDLPLDAMARTPFSGSYPLTTRGQKLELAFGPREDLVHGRNPVVSIDAEIGKLMWTYHFVTDQSCLRAFATALSAAIDPD